jgi:surfactin synthase thioesterase subunit
VGDDTRVIVAHSLGSIVAYEVAHLVDRPLPLLITLGSPLGVNTIVRPQLRPQPPRFPPQVRRWVNVADTDDLVAAEPNLANVFGPSLPRDAILEGSYTVDNGAEPHNAEFYLGKEHIGRPIGQVFSTV